MILTQEFLDLNNVCSDGQICADEGSYIGQDYDEVIKDLLRRGLRDDAGWMMAAKNTETYVRMNGSVITMGAYQVYNPLTGLHTRYETESEARAALLEISKQVLELHSPIAVQELSNEKGDAVWVPTSLHKTLTIS